MTLVSDLSTLESSGLIRLAATHPDLEYLFRHALVQEAAYQSLVKQDRRHLHRTVGEALERMYADQEDELAPTLAYHFERAEAYDKAIYYLLRAGDRAKRSYANTEAIAFYQTAISLLNRLPRREVEQLEARHEATTRLYESLGDLLELTGQHEEARTAYKSGLIQVPKYDRFWQSRLYRKIAKTWVLEHRREEALQAYGMAETTLGQEPVEADPKWWQEWAQIRLDQVWLHYILAEVHEIAELLEEAQPVVEQYGTPTQRAKLFESFVLIANRRDCFMVSEQTLGYAQATLTASRESSNLSEIAFSQFALAFCHLWRGEFDEAEEHMQSARALSERIGDVTVQSRCLTYLTVLYRKRGQLNEVGHYIARSSAMAAAVQLPEYIGMAKANLAWVAWCEGNLSEAQQNGRDALRLWQQNTPAFPFQWTALWPLIAAALVEGKIYDAVEYARALLMPKQQRLPAALTTLLEEAIRAWERDSSETVHTRLNQAIKLAQEMRYL